MNKLSKIVVTILIVVMFMAFLLLLTAVGGRYSYIVFLIGYGAFRGICAVWRKKDNNDNTPLQN